MSWPASATPQHLTRRRQNAQKSDAPAMEEVMPKVFEQLAGVRQTLEKHYRDNAGHRVHRCSAASSTLLADGTASAPPRRVKIAVVHGALIAGRYRSSSRCRSGSVAPMAHREFGAALSGAALPLRVCSCELPRAAGELDSCMSELVLLGAADVCEHSSKMSDMTTLSIRRSRSELSRY